MHNALECRTARRENSEAAFMGSKEPGREFDRTTSAPLTLLARSDGFGADAEKLTAVTSGVAVFFSIALRECPGSSPLVFTDPLLAPAERVEVVGQSPENGKDATTESDGHNTSVDDEKKAEEVERVEAASVMIWQFRETW